MKFYVIHITHVVEIEAEDLDKAMSKFKQERPDMQPYNKFVCLTEEGSSLLSSWKKGHP